MLRALALAPLLLAAAPAAPALDVQTGDVVFHESRSSQSAALQVATGSRYTHVGLVVVETDGAWVLEAVQPVKKTRLDAWVRRGVDGHVVIKRPRTPLSADQASAVTAAAATHLGKPYDLAFGWSDEAIYCSELVYKAYRDGAGMQLGTLRRHQDYALDEASIQTAIRARYPEGVPTDEPVIAPSDLFAAPELVEVGRRP